MRSEDHIVQLTQRGGEQLLARGRFLGVDVDSGTRDVARTQIVDQGVNVDDLAAGKIEEQRARPHHGKLPRSNEVVVARASINVQGHGIDAAQQLFHRLTLVGVPHGQDVGNVVEEDLHAHGFGHHGELLADISVPNDAKTTTADLVGPDGGLAPHPVVHLGVAITETTGQCNDLRHHQFNNRTGVGIRGVEGRNTSLGHGGQIHLVRANAEGTHGGEVVATRLDDSAADASPRPDAQQINSVEGTDEVVLVEGLAHPLDLVTGMFQGSNGFIVDVFEQERLHDGQFMEGAGPNYRARLSGWNRPHGCEESLSTTPG